MSTTTLLTSTASGASSYLLPSLALLAMGCLLHIGAYESLEPVGVGIISYIAGLWLLRISFVGGVFERVGYRLVFSICWFWAGISAVYANIFNDALQNTRDAAMFFALARQGDTGLLLEDILGLGEGSLAVFTWMRVYDLFAALGFDRGRYIGVTFNVLLVSMTGVLGVKMVKLLFGVDPLRINRFILLFSLCGLFWMFASIHIRDAATLFAVSALMFFWVRYLAVPHLYNLMWLVAASIVALPTFGFLRKEFAFVPIAMLAVGLVAVLLGNSSKGGRRLWIYVIAVFGIIVFTIILASPDLQLLDALVDDILVANKEHYTEVSAGESDASSLGYRLVVSAPLAVRLVLGSAYLLIMPIPVWHGFQLENAYDLFLSFYALFMYALIPLLGLAVYRMAQYKELRTAPLLFLLFIIVGFTLSIAGTSVEQRHLGSFFSAFVLLATVPDLNDRVDRRAYSLMLQIFLGVMIFLHVLRVPLKFF